MEVRRRFLDSALAVLQESITVRGLSGGVLSDVYVVVGYVLFANLFVSPVLSLCD